MMKTIKYFILLGAVGMMSLFTACEKNLDLNPELSIDYDLVYVDEDGVKLALDGAWSLVGSENLYAGTSIFHSDLLAGSSAYVVWQGTFIGYRQMFNKALNKNEATIANKWITAYRAINIVNNVLANLDKVETDPDRVEGEAKFIRGILYFELVRFYAQPWGFEAGNTHLGVPIVLTPVQTYEDVTFPARATVGAVYTQILNDLGDAKDLLAPGKAGANRGLATSTNASALLARVYLSQKDWPNAAAEATVVINEFGGANALNSTPKSCFNNPGYTSEDVFMIRQNLYSHAGQSNDGIGTFFASLAGFGRGDVRATRTHLRLFEEPNGDTILIKEPGMSVYDTLYIKDLRAKYEVNSNAKVINEFNTMYYYGIGSRGGWTRTSKWGRYETNIPVIRLAEMYLTRAEANFMNSSSIGNTPISDLNIVRARANADLIAAPGDVNLDLIKLDRYKELCFEGHSLHDLKRWQGNVGAIAWDSYRLVLPIPQREIDVNPNLVQHSYYE
jgi:starch-binding outer membrane protein, SusD/RagB family